MNQPHDVCVIEGRGVNMNNDPDHYITRIRNLSPNQRKRLVEKIAAMEKRPPKPDEKPIAGMTAYVVPRKGERVETGELRELLSARLPDYMIPSDIVVLDTLPLHPNGKVDRRALQMVAVNALNKKACLVEPQTPFEKEMAKIWGEVLKLRRINMNDNFFEAGGDSLLAVKLFALIKSRTGQDLPLALLFETGTLQELVARIMKEKERTAVYPAPRSKPSPKPVAPYIHTYEPSASVEGRLWKTVIPLRPEGNLLPLFLMHSVGGNVLNYSALIPYMSNRQPLYGLQARGLDGVTEPFHNLHDMAAQYVSEIQDVQPHGPYLLAGGSTGGVIALEMAQQLKDKGEPILFLGLFDTINPKAEYRRKKTDIAAKFEAMLRSKSAFKIVLKSKFNRLVELCKNVYYGTMCSIYRSARRPIPQFFRYWYIARHNLRVTRRYRPKPYSGHITLFQSIEAEYELPDNGWGTIARDGLDIIPIPARHGKFIESEALGRKLSLCLDEVQKQYRKSPAAIIDGGHFKKAM